MEWGRQQFGPRYSLGQKVYFFFDPESAGQVGRATSSSLLKPGHMTPFLGINTVTANGAVWRKHRRLIAPQFHKRRIEESTPIIEKHAKSLSQKWSTSPVHDGVLDFSTAIFELACEIFFGSVLKIYSDQLRDDLHTLTSCVTKRAKSWIRLPLAIPTPGHLRARSSRKRLERIVEDIIQEKKRNLQSETKSFNLLAHLIEARDPETGETFSQKELRDEVSTLLTVGHDTTANSLVWTVFLLARNQEVQDQIAEQLQAGSSSALLDQVINESLRLYPSAPVLTRLAAEPTQIAGVDIPKGAAVIVSPYITQRDPAHWNEAEQFVPERFKNGRPEDLSYFPFGLGARSCVGEGLARNELRIFLTELCRSWRWSVPAEFKPNLQVGITLGLSELPLTVKRRN